jgi:apolipoprotein N-acyltransferase
MNPIVAALLSMAAGATLPLAFAPLNWWWLALGCSAIWICALSHVNTTGAVTACALLFHAAAQLAGHHWAYAALLVDRGGSPLEATAIICAVMGYASLVSSLPIVFWGWLANSRYRGGRTVSISTLPTALLIGELLRSESLAGFSSLTPGYAAIDTPLAPLLPLGSVWLASWMIYALATMPALAWQMLKTKNQWLPWTVSTCLTLLVCGVAVRSGSGQWVQPHAGPLTVSVLQTHVDPREKFQAPELDETVKQLVVLLKRSQGAVVVTPETALPAPLAELSYATQASLVRALPTPRTKLLLGAPLVMGTALQNAIVELDAQGLTGQAYAKEHLMPFGEFTPTLVSRDLAALNVPLNDLEPGKANQASLKLPGNIEAHGLICHEDLLPSAARDRALHSQLLINPTNLAWFAPLASAQRLQIARARAAETGRPMVRAANREGSAFIDSNGAAYQKASPGARVLTASVQPTKGQTPWVQMGLPGTLAGLLCAQTLLSISFILKHRSRQSGDVKRERSY